MWKMVKKFYAIGALELTFLHGLTKCGSPFVVLYLNNLLHYWMHQENMSVQ